MVHKFSPNTHLKRIREERNWTQKQLATKIGTNSVSISRWESGERVPTLYFRAKLCEVFGKSPLDLGFLNADEDSPVSIHMDQQTTHQSPTSSVVANSMTGSDP